LYLTPSSHLMSVNFLHAAQIDQPQEHLTFYCKLRSTELKTKK